MDYRSKYKGSEIEAKLDEIFKSHLQDKAVEITENGVTEVTADAGFTGLSKVVVNTNVASSGGGSGWTGHADVEGLRAIGWTDEDIAYYQENGVNWNEEDDEYHKVSDDNKALYGVLNADNVASYITRIVYLPKLDTSGKESMAGFLNGCKTLVAIPFLDISAATSTNRMFYNCNSLTCVPPLNTSKVTDAGYMFRSCFTLNKLPLLDTQNVTNMSNMFQNCYSLAEVPLMMTSKVTDMGYMFQNCYNLRGAPSFDMTAVINANYIFSGCGALESIRFLDVSKTNSPNAILGNCISLKLLNLENLRHSFDISDSALLVKESLIYMINKSTSVPVTITLHAYAYTRLAEDADVVAALANHPNISLASA